MGTRSLHLASSSVYGKRRDAKLHVLHPAMHPYICENCFCELSQRDMWLVRSSHRLTCENKNIDKGQMASNKLTDSTHSRSSIL
ncbi:hypothetical protein Sjap_010540 [Stephania japonica]|uniref:Uncharacterized protein n=1 Tax=Stephania japonica TaxID=461633 RepID=A0AAP0JBS7_9MAGN